MSSFHPVDSISATKPKLQKNYYQIRVITLTLVETISSDIERKSIILSTDYVVGSISVYDETGNYCEVKRLGME